MITLRELCETSDRIDEVDYAIYKKEIGAVEIHGLEDYFLSILNSKEKVKNTPNSTIAYLIHITDEQPTQSVEYKGGSLPDIDTDFADDRRQDVIQYLIRKYGEDKVAGIGTYGTMWARGAIRNAGRSLGMELEFVDSIAKMIPPMVQGRDWHIPEAIEESRELQEAIKNNENAAELLNWAGKIDNVLNSRGQHASAVVITRDKVADTMPTFRNNNEFSVVEFTGPEAEALGAVKVDLLGLKTLTVISNCLALMKENGVDLSFDNIPIDDEQSFKLIQTGKLLGVFQLEGQGISSYTKGYKPVNIEDIIMILAGYRPGPMQFMQEILKIRNTGTWDVVQPTGEKYPVISNLLEKTYGYFIYQEQIQKIAEELAGYNKIEADEFRKMIAKKQREKLEKEKKRFFAKAIEKGMSENDVSDLWTQMEDFSAYCFNRSHAVGYAILSMKTAYLKANYAAEYYVANIKAEIGDIEKIASLISEAKYFGINILPPDINKSGYDFTIINRKEVRFGLSGIKGVGQKMAEPIIEERKKNGKFINVSNFVYRTNVRSNVFEALISIGCFDSMALRSQLLNKCEENTYYLDLLELSNYIKTKELLPLSFSKEWIELPFTFEYGDDKIMELEKQYTDLFISSSPMETYSNEINLIQYDIEIANEKSKWKKYSVAFGFMTDFKKFKSGKGCSFGINDKRFLALTKVLDSLENPILKYLGQFVCVKYSMGKDQEVCFVDNITLMSSLYTESNSKKIMIRLNKDGLNTINALASKYQISEKHNNNRLHIEIYGTDYRKTILTGITNK